MYFVSEKIACTHDNGAAYDLEIQCLPLRASAAGRECGEHHRSGARIRARRQEKH